MNENNTSQEVADEFITMLNKFGFIYNENEIKEAFKNYTKFTLIEDDKGVIHVVPGFAGKGAIFYVEYTNQDYKIVLVSDGEEAEVLFDGERKNEWDSRRIY